MIVTVLLSLLSEPQGVRRGLKNLKNKKTKNKLTNAKSLHLGLFVSVYP